MKLTDKLDVLMERRGLTRGSLAAAANVPYNTIVGLYTKGYASVKLSTLRPIAACLGVSLDALADDGKELESPDESAAAVARRYGALSRRSRAIVDGVIDGLAGLESAPEEAPEKVTYIREYVTPAAAGYASPAEGEDYVLIPRGPEVPARADFAVRISGDSMEPYIADGSRVYVARMESLTDGDVGIFFVDGDMKCKQYVEDSFGNIYLFSANRARADADVTVLASSGIMVVCFGKVLLPKKPPMPRI